jgi:hypothetical protein
MVVVPGSIPPVPTPKLMTGPKATGIARACRILCKRDFGLQVNSGGAELDDRAVKGGLPVAAANQQPCEAIGTFDDKDFGVFPPTSVHIPVYASRPRFASRTSRARSSLAKF